MMACAQNNHSHMPHAHTGPAPLLHQGANALSRHCLGQEGETRRKQLSGAISSRSCLQTAVPPQQTHAHTTLLYWLQTRACTTTIGCVCPGLAMHWGSPTPAAAAAAGTQVHAPDLHARAPLSCAPRPVSTTLLDVRVEGLNLNPNP